MGIVRKLELPKTSFFLFGPRGTGKTTWLRQNLKTAKTIQLLNEGVYQDLLANPGSLSDELRTLAAHSWVVIDEIQRLPNLLNTAHEFIEEKKLRFALTGSSARKLKRAGVNLLAGRAVKKTMYPLTPQELQEHFNLDQALRYGTVALIHSSPDKKETLMNYVQMYLKEEIQAEALVRRLDGFSRFLPIAALFHGQTLNISNIARDAGVQRPTVSNYIDILEDTLLANRLDAFESDIRVREKSLPKFYWIDPGIVRAIRKNLASVSHEEKGPLLEGFIYMLLRNQQGLFGEIDSIAYWSPAEAIKTEVDFVLTYGKENIAVEVKATDRLRPEHFKGLKAIAELKSVKRKVLVYLGQRRLKTEDGVDVLPFNDFILELEKRKL